MKLTAVLTWLLRNAGQGPVAEAEPAAQHVQPGVEPERGVVSDRAEQGQPLHVPADAVEVVAVDHQQAAAVGGLVDRVVPDAHAGERAADPLAQGFVVIAGQVDHLGAARRAPQQPVQDLVVLVRPEPALAQAPAVDDVTDQVQILRFDMVQEIEEAIGLAASTCRGVRPK